MELTKISRQRATDEVYEALRQSILGHLFAPGERLQVEEIAAKLGVSLTPVRHAIQQLATEGLIEIKPRSGTFVAKLTSPFFGRAYAALTPRTIQLSLRYKL